MIEKILLKDVATYPVTDPVELNNLKKINFFFGGNGTGKTTIYKLISNPGNFKKCSLLWESGNQLKTLVFNDEFVGKYFYEPPEFPGIFTMDDNAPLIEEKIISIKEEIENLNNVNRRNSNTFNQKNEELEKREKLFYDTCWDRIYKIYQQDFSETFKGYGKGKDKLAERLLKESDENNSGVAKKEELKRKYDLIYNNNLDIIEELELINPEIISSLITIEKNDILKSIIIGKQDVNIAKMIHKLQNQDWIRGGIIFYNRNYDKSSDCHICPFCQQHTSKDFQKQLEEYFDETFKSKMQELENFKVQYDELAMQIKSIISAMDKIENNKYLDKNKSILNSLSQLMNEKIKNNKLVFVKKQNEPSTKCELTSILTLIEKVNEEITKINNEVRKHNSILRDKNKKQIFNDEIWKYLSHDIENEIIRFKIDKNDIEKAIYNITSRIRENNTKISELDIEILENEKKIKSVVPTVEAINHIIDSYGFKGFRLKPTEDNKRYQIIRDDGNPAKETLSEGERNFVVFLYFYHLVKGVINPNDQINENRVVVFDDPVSSFDSNVLFLVSSLIRNIIIQLNDVDPYNIKQVFVLTHNVHFFKEVTFQINKNTMFYVVKKNNNVSKIKEYETNPVKTTYQLLWECVKDNEVDNISKQNNMRRIIEYYFKILCNLNQDQIVNSFSNSIEQIVCKSLFSYINSGSHEVFFEDDYSTQGISIGIYDNVFRKIFEETGQINHYNMMMGITSHEVDFQT